MSSMSTSLDKVDSDWKTGAEIAKLVKVGDVVEIDLGKGVYHYIFNIRNGWCVHVTSPDVIGPVTDVIKDATDLLQETGKNRCRINNFVDLASEKSLTPRSLKESLTLARSGLAHGPISVPLTDITSVTKPDNIAKEFCVFWKYVTPESELQLSNQVRGIFFIFQEGLGCNV